MITYAVRLLSRIFFINDLIYRSCGYSGAAFFENVVGMWPAFHRSESIDQQNIVISPIGKTEFSQAVDSSGAAFSNDTGREHMARLTRMQ